MFDLNFLHGGFILIIILVLSLTVFSLLVDYGESAMNYVGCFVGISIPIIITLLFSGFSFLISACLLIGYMMLNPDHIPEIIITLLLISLPFSLYLRYKLNTTDIKGK